MSAPSSSQVRFQTVQNSSVRIYFAGVGAAGTAGVKAAVDKIHGLLIPQFQEIGIFFDQDGDHIVEKQQIPGSYVIEQPVQPTYSRTCV
jgi:hypothetical protein